MDNIDVLHKRIDELTAKLDRVRNQNAPTLPIYDSTNFPQDAIEGQTAIAQSSSGIAGETSMWAYKDSQWQELGSRGDIRYNVYNDNSSPGFLDITMHDYLSLQNYGPGGTLILDDGGGGMQIVTNFGGNIDISTFPGDINIQTIGSAGGGIYILSGGTNGYIQLDSTTELDIDAGGVIEIRSGNRIVHLIGPNPVHPDVPNEIIVGTSPSGGITGNIYIGNEGGFLSIIEEGGTRIASGISLLLAGHARYPLTLSAYKSHIIFESDYVEMGSLSFGSTLPTPVVGSSCILYVYEYTPGTYGLYAMLGTTRTRLASS